jgi:asparagine synthase (glutamine-hydrolysing)
MANFIAIVDPDEARRQRFERTVQPLLPLVEGLTSGRTACGNLVVLWAAALGAPVSSARTGHGAAVIWGNALDDRSATPIDASALALRWRGQAERTGALDGYHAALAWDESEAGFTLGADLLGLYPVYYADLGDVLLAGSSPELFRRHPRFAFDIDPLALTGILLNMHLLQGRTLCDRSRRLAGGHLLQWRARRGAREAEQYRIRPSRRFYDLPFSAQTPLLAEALQASVQRHAPAGQRYGLMLSGGRDSRLLAGCLGKQQVQVSALSLGSGQDLDVRCAKAVARALHLEHRVREVEVGSYVDYARRQAAWEHGAQGFNTVMGWGVHRLLSDMPRAIVNGYLGDAIFGGSHIEWARVIGSSAMSFDAFFRQVNAYGIQPDALRKLVRTQRLKDSVAEAVEGMRATYLGYSDLESERAWCFDLYHRQRYYIGGELWRLSFGAWPLNPYVDRRLIEVCGGMPAATLGERRGQDAVLCRYFPQLARLPLDRNTFDATPLQPRLPALIASSIRRRIGHRLPQPERRRYYRLWTINGPGWRAVRWEAEKYRHLAHAWFDPAMLAALLPGPEVNIEAKDAIIDTSGLKIILGFMLWLGHLDAPGLAAAAPSEAAAA